VSNLLDEWSFTLHTGRFADEPTRGQSVHGLDRSSRDLRLDDLWTDQFAEMFALNVTKSGN